MVKGDRPLFRKSAEWRFPAHAYHDGACAYLAETVYTRKGVLSRTIQGSEAAVVTYTAVGAAVDRLKLHIKSGQKLRHSDVQDPIAAINAHPGMGIERGACASAE